MSVREPACRCCSCVWAARAPEITKLVDECRFENLGRCWVYSHTILVGTGKLLPDHLDQFSLGTLASHVHSKAELHHEIHPILGTVSQGPEGPEARSSPQSGLGSLGFFSRCIQSVEDLVSDVLVVSGHDCQHGNLISGATAGNAMLTSTEVADDIAS